MISLMSAGVGNHVGGVQVGIGVWLDVPCIWHHGGSCGECEWLLGVVSVSLGVRVGELASEGRKEKGGHLLGQGGDHVHGGFMWV